MSHLIPAAVPIAAPATAADVTAAGEAAIERAKDYCDRRPATRGLSPAALWLSQAPY
jgi:hypothetical protein